MGYQVESAVVRQDRMRFDATRRLVAVAVAVGDLQLGAVAHGGSQTAQYGHIDVRPSPH